MRLRVQDGAEVLGPDDEGREFIAPDDLGRPVSGMTVVDVEVMEDRLGPVELLFEVDPARNVTHRRLSPG